MTALAIALAFFSLVAQSQPIPDPVSWKLEQPARTGVDPGSAIVLLLVARIAPGWHLYAMAQPPGGPISTEISLAPGQSFSFARPIRASKPVTILDPNFDMRIEMYSDKATFTLPLTVSPSAAAGAHSIAVNARYQTCNDTICLPPRTVRVETEVHVRK